MQKSNLLHSLQALALNALSFGFAVIISGFNNETKEDSTDALAAHLQLALSKYAPVVLPCSGIWQGETERSLLVTLRAEDGAVPELVAELRALCKEYNQQAAILAHRGSFLLVDGKTAANDCTIGKSFAVDFNPDTTEGYTLVYLDHARTNELARFTITA